jgi:hypothetical protein
MNEISVVKHYEQKARQICDEIDALRRAEPVARDSRILAALDALRESAKVVAENAMAPVKIGILGEFSAGKTLLIGSLIGYADGLPISELPTTGNVTALNLGVDEELTATHFGDYRIHFLDHDGYRKCLAFMLEKACKQARTASLREDLIKQVQAISEESEQSLSRIEAWAHAAWKSTANPSLRFLLRELVGFVRAYAKCGEGLCSSEEPFVVSAEIAKVGLSLPVSNEGIQNLDFSELPSPRHSISTRPQSLTKELLKDAFPLVRLVSVDVRISRHIWDLTGLTGTDRFCLMDFPGLGSEFSGVRDLFLCLRELDQIQTILVVLNGRRPGGNEGSRLYDLLQEHRKGQDIRDMILVSVGRFDELPLQNEGLEETLRQMAGQPGRNLVAVGRNKASTSIILIDEDEAPFSPDLTTGPLTVNKVLEALPVLARCVSGAESIAASGRHDRITFVSPLFHLRFLQEKNPSISPGSKEFLASNQQAADRAAEMAALWGKVADRLKAQHADKSRHPLVKWLEEFSIDGGIGQLRSVIVSHVKTHGILQRYKDISRQVEKLRKDLQSLMAVLPADSPILKVEQSDTLVAVEKELRSLIELYENVRNSLLSSDAHFTVSHEGISMPLIDALKDEIVRRIYEWPQWDDLWRSVQDGYIRNSSPGGIFDFEEGDEQSDSRILPTSSDHFYDVFAQTVEGLVDYTKDLVDQGVTGWLHQLDERIAPARALLSRFVTRPSLKVAIQALNLRDTRGVATAVKAAIDPLMLKRLAFQPDGRIAEWCAELPKTDPPALFPLARRDRSNPGRVFAWDPVFSRLPEALHPPKHHSHQAMILRIRDLMADAVEMEMSQVLSFMLDQVVARLADALNELCEKLSLAVTMRPVLEVLVQADVTGPDASEDSGQSSQILHRLRNLALTNV